MARWACGRREGPDVRFRRPCEDKRVWAFQSAQARQWIFMSVRPVQKFPTGPTDRGLGGIEE